MIHAVRAHKGYGTLQAAVRSDQRNALNINEYRPENGGFRPLNARFCGQN